MVTLETLWMVFGRFPGISLCSYHHDGICMERADFPFYWARIWPSEGGNVWVERSAIAPQLMTLEEAVAVVREWLSC